MYEDIMMYILSKNTCVVERMVVYPHAGNNYALVEIYPNKNRRTTEIVNNYEEEYGVIITLNTVYIDKNKEFYRMNKEAIK